MQSLRQGGQKVGGAVCPGNHGEQSSAFQQGIGGIEKFPEGLRRSEERTAAQVGRRHAPVALHSPRRVAHHAIEHRRAGKIFAGGQSFTHEAQVFTAVHVSAERREVFLQPQSGGIALGGFRQHGLAFQPHAFPARLLQQNGQRHDAAACAELRQYRLFRQSLLRRKARQKERVRTEAEAPFRLFESGRERLARRTDVC